MKVIIHDLDTEFEKTLQSKCNQLISADGKYAGCQGCFSCWTKYPAECVIHDKLKEISRLVGKADELVQCLLNNSTLYFGHDRIFASR